MTDIGYREAMDKIESIVAELDNDQMDIDILGEKVEEAVKLIAICKNKLRTTEEKVGLILKDMNIDDDEKADENLKEDLLF